MKLSALFENLSLIDRGTGDPRIKGAYKIIDIILDGRKVGDFKLIWGKTTQVNYVNIHPDYLRRGIAFEAYKKLIEWLRREGKTLESSLVNDKSKGLWEKLVRDGYAITSGSGFSSIPEDKRI